MTLWQKSFVGFLVLVIFVMFTPVIKANAADPRDIPAYANDAIMSALEAHYAAVSTPNAPANRMASSIVWTATDHVYTTKKGDNLTRIAKLFNVPRDELFAYNPDIKNKNLIRMGKKIHIPVFRKKRELLNDIADTGPVVLAKSDLVKLIDQRDRYEARIKELEADNVRRTHLEYTLYGVIFALAVSLIIVGSKKRSYPKYGLLPFGNAEDVKGTLRFLTGQQLVEVVDGTFVKDECGNAVSLKNLKDFLACDKRAYLRQLPANQWKEAMAAREKGDSVKYTAIPPVI